MAYLLTRNRYSGVYFTQENFKFILAQTFTSLFIFFTGKLTIVLNDCVFNIKNQKVIGYNECFSLCDPTIPLLYFFYFFFLLLKKM